VLCPEQALELAPDVHVLHHGDLGDEPIETQTHRRIADAIASGHVFQGSRRDHEPLDEREVLLAHVLQPAASHQPE